MVGVVASNHESNPLLQQQWNNQQRVVRYNARKRQRRNCCIIVAAVGILVGCFILLTSIKHGSDPNSKNEIVSLLGRARQAKSMVHIDTQSGAYSVNFDESPDRVTSTTTFAELAEICIHPWYEASIMSVIDDPAWSSENGISPSNVKNIRRSLLMTRDMIDVFGPVFSDARYPPTKKLRSKKHIHNAGVVVDERAAGGGGPEDDDDAKDRSLWRKLRVQYRDGYQKMGYLKDLEGLTYSQDLLRDRVTAVMEWKASFLEFQKQNRIRHFLYTQDLTQGGGIDPYGCYQHKSSHLFWAETTTIPCGHDGGTQALQLVAVEQLQHSLSYLQTIQNYTTVVPESHAIQFHNLRKELRILLDEYKLFGTILVPTTAATSSSSSAVTKLSTTSDPRNTTTAAGSSIKKEDVTTTTVTMMTLDEMMTTLDKAQKKLGKIHDKWAARDIYVQDDTHHSKQVSLETKIDTMWFEFLKWQNTVFLEECMRTVMQRMGGGEEEEGEDVV